MLNTLARGITALLLAALACAARAETYPSRPVTIIVPQQAGSNSDNVMRPLAAALQAALGQPFTIDNRVGANGIIGVTVAARAKPDGYTLLVASSTSFVANPALYKKLDYDPVKDFRGIANIGKTSMMFVTRPDFPARSVDELLTYAKRQGKPLDIGYGSSTAQIAISLLASSSGATFEAVPYKGTPQLTTDLIGGVLPVGVVDVGNGAQQIRNGQLKALAITDVARSTFAPDVPTLSERYAGVTLVSWIAVVAPAGTPDAIVRTLYEALRQAIARPDVVQRFAAAGTTIALAPPEAVDQEVRDDLPRWNALIRAAGIERE